VIDFSVQTQPHDTDLVYPGIHWFCAASGTAPRGSRPRLCLGRHCATFGTCSWTGTRRASLLPLRQAMYVIRHARLAWLLHNIPTRLRATATTSDATLDAAPVHQQALAEFAVSVVASVPLPTQGTLPSTRVAPASGVQHVLPAADPVVLSLIVLGFKAASEDRRCSPMVPFGAVIWQSPVEPFNLQETLFCLTRRWQ
jgi:hypothetical protein